MHYLTSNEREQLSVFALTENGGLVRKLIEQNIKELGDVSTLDSDPILSRKKAIAHLQDNLLSYVQEKDQRQKEEVETYE